MRSKLHELFLRSSVAVHPNSKKGWWMQLPWMHAAPSLHARPCKLLHASYSSNPIEVLIHARTEAKDWPRHPAQSPLKDFNMVRGGE